MAPKVSRQALQICPLQDKGFNLKILRKEVKGIHPGTYSLQKELSAHPKREALVPWLPNHLDPRGLSVIGETYVSEVVIKFELAAQKYS